MPANGLSKLGLGRCLCEPFLHSFILAKIILDTVTSKFKRPRTLGAGLKLVSEPMTFKVGKQIPTTGGNNAQ